MDQGNLVRLRRSSVISTHLTMPTPKNQDSLSLRLKGDLPIEKFEKAVGAFFALIKEVTKTALHDDQRIRWTVSVRAGSAIVSAIPHYKPDVADQAAQILRIIPEGIKAMERGTEEMPVGFTREAVKSVRTLASVRGLKGSDVTSIDVGSGKERSIVTAKSFATAESLVGGQRQSYGSIEGKMQTITERGGFRFVVYDSLFDRKVDCFIDEELMEKAVANFRKRVRVSGLVQFDRFGDPVSIKVSDIYVFRPNSDLPTVHSMRGLLKEA